MERALSTRSNDRADQYSVIGPQPEIRVQIFTEAGSLIKVSLFDSPNFVLDTTYCEKDLIPRFLFWLKAYSKRESPSLNLPFSKDFKGQVLTYLQSIPCGKLVTYKDVAEAVQNPRAARGVGNICRGNSFPLFIPCHRVIRSDGHIGHYTPDPTFKLKLLQFERAL